MNDHLQNLSAEDRRNLSKAFQKDSAKREAEKLGTSVENLRQKVVGGKYQWVQQAKVLHEEEKRKQIEMSSRPIRALRGGENSLVSLIQKMIQTHENRANELEKQNHIQAIEKLDLFNNINNIISRTESFAAELAQIENNIENTKSQVPVFAEAEKALLLLSQLKKQGEMEKVQQLQKKCASLFANYQNQRKKLNPLIEGARFQRACLQREYWRIMLAHFNLQISVFENDCRLLVDKVIALSTSKDKTDLLSELDETKVHVKGIVERKDTLSRSIPSDTQSNESEKSWDNILPVMPPLLDEIAFMIEVLKTIDDKIPENVELAATAPSAGMAFANKKAR